MIAFFKHHLATVAWGLALLLSLLGAACASDHADPTLKPPPSQDANITGLFVFPRGDRMIVILNVHRALLSPPPYQLEEYEYHVNIDLESVVGYDNPADLARYGGTVVAPDGIRPTVRITFRLDKDVKLLPGYPKVDGPLSNPESFEVYAGVRDDPFIFPRFFKKNVISMAVSIPFSSFPAGQQDWLFWSTLTRQRDGKQIDHVGRSNRTQLARLDFLNTLPPSEHVAAIKKKYDSGQKVEQFLMRAMSYLPILGALSGGFEYVLQIRDYDIFPDVVFFTTRFPPGFPNGRQLTDDVAGLTCAQGDCVLQDVAFIEGHWPRIVVNDKPFPDQFPYLGEPWPEQPPEPTPMDFTLWILGAIVLMIALIVVYFLRRRQRRIETPYVAPYRRTL